jgi:hypothetical protein
MNPECSSLAGLKEFLARGATIGVGDIVEVDFIIDEDIGVDHIECVFLPLYV